MRLFLLFITLLSVSTAFSQQQTIDSLRTIYKNKAILLDMPYYYKGAERFSFKELRREFSSSNAGLLELEQGLRNYKTASILRLTSLAATITSFFFINKNRNVTYGLLGASLVSNTIGLRFSLTGRKLLHRAVFKYNEELLFGASR
jgi:hypothetical protein